MTRTSSRALALAAAFTVFAAARASAQEPTPADTTKPVPAVQDTQKAAPAPAARRAPRRSRNQITREEIDAAQVTDTHQIVQRLHPEWLRARGTYSTTHIAQVVVYRDGSPIGGADALNQVPLAQVRLIRYFDTVMATQRFGTGHEGGVIEVLTR